MAAGSPHKISKRHVEGSGDECQVVDQRRVRALLDPVDRLPVEADPLREAFLCELLACAFGADVVPDGPALQEYPVGHGVGWHGSTLVGAVIDVCTIDGTFTEQTRSADATKPPLKRSFE